MGTWGSAIFANDTACDVRSLYEELLCYGHSPQSAEQQVLEELGMDIRHPEDDPDAWLALAATEWRCGRLLTEDVRRVALMLIDQPVSWELWETQQQQLSRRKALARLREQLNAPLPRPKRLKPLPALHSPWRVGDVVALRLPECADYPELSGQYAMMLVTEIETCRVSRYAPEDMTTDTPYFIIYHWWGSDLSRCAEVMEQAVFALRMPSRQLFRAFALYQDEMALYRQHPVVGHVELPELKQLRAQYRYDPGMGLSQRATLLNVQAWLAHAEPVRLSCIADATRPFE